MPRKNPDTNRYSVTQQMSKDRYDATIEAVKDLGPALGDITVRNLGIKPGRVFEAVAKHEGRNVTDLKKVPLAPGHVAVEIVTPADAHQVRPAIHQRTEEILAEGIPQRPQLASQPAAHTPVQSTRPHIPQSPQIFSQTPTELPPHGGW